MEILFVLVPLGIGFIAVAAALLVWALNSGQYDDLEEWSQRLPDEER